MYRVLRSFVIFTVFALLSGCGADTVAVRPEATANMHTIALIRIKEPALYVAQDFGNPGMMFGAIGGAVAGSSSANAGKNVNQIASESGFSAGEQLTNLIQQKLTTAGYKVKLITVSREKAHKLLEKYDSVDATSADAIMDVAIESIGYATEHPMLSPYWRPASQVQVALVNSHTHDKIYAEKFMYGYHNPFMSGTDLDAPKEFQFKDKDALFADSTRLVDGMQESLDSVADHIVTALKK